MFPPEIWGCIGLYCDIKTLRMLSYVTESSGEACRLLNFMHSKLIALHKQYADMTSVDTTVPHPYTDFGVRCFTEIRPIEKLVEEWSILKKRDFCMKYFSGFICKMWPKLHFMNFFLSMTPNYGLEKLQFIVEKDNSDITIHMGYLTFDYNNQTIFYQTNTSSSFEADIKKMIMAFIQLFCDGFDLPFICKNEIK